MPDKHGHFEEFGGKYVPETLIPALDELEQEYFKSKKDKNFQKEFFNLLKYYGGRPTPLYLAKNISGELGFNVWLKREDLNHTGAHKINNALGQILLARKMGKKRIITKAFTSLSCHILNSERLSPNTLNMLTDFESSTLRALLCQLQYR